MQKTTNTYLELGESNIFEEFYELLEGYRLKNFSDFSINDLYECLYNFDVAYQAFNSNNPEHTNKILYLYINECLSKFLVIFKIGGFSDRPIYWSLIRFIKFSTFLLDNSNGIDNLAFFFRNLS